ncbi:XRE family transcriptional regulator [Kitasatospora sp. NPDC049285]|uniref:XRE family transcriptional regulator n=1 Tax=Kitasatospora sp. NPDC049285 TaxID=3157096 RepID=UPI00344A6E03
MVTRVERWTGREASALQQVLRMSDRAFAEHLDISRNTVVTWRQKGASVMCNSNTAQLLDSAVALLSPADRAEFQRRLQQNGEVNLPSEAGPSAGPQLSLVSHQFIPVQLGTSAEILFRAGTEHPHGPAELDQRTHALRGNTDDRRARLHVYGFGIGVLHLEQNLRPNSVTELALWRYPSYPGNRRWTQQAVMELATTLVGREVTIDQPEYVLSVYEVRTHPWSSGDLDTGLQLMATPSVLVDRSDELRPVSLGIEADRFEQGWSHRDAIRFAGGVSHGVAGWSGVAYHPDPAERALPIGAIVALELDLQALWALSLRMLHPVKNGQDPETLPSVGWRWLRGVLTKLTSAGPTETAQHRAMREAIVGTSDLPKQLSTALEALKEIAP